MRAEGWQRLGRCALVVFVLVGLVGLGPVADPVGADLADGLGTVTVAPDTDLLDGATVTANVVGGEPDLYLDVLLCVTGVPEPDGCSTRALGSTAIDGTGTASVTGVVRTVVHRYDGVATDCRVAACEVLFVAYDPASAAGDYVVERVPVTFDPAGPLLPAPTVTVDPRNDLVDGSEVRVTGSGFEARGFVDLSLCHPEGGCRYLGDTETDAAGALDTVLRLRATVSSWTPTGATTLDCRTATGGCSLRASSSHDDVTVALGFDPHAPLLPPPTLSVAPDTDLVDGQTVTVSGSGFDPNGFTSLQYCEVGTENCDRVWSASPQIETDGSFSLTTELYGDLVAWDGYVDCRTAPGCEIRAREFTEHTTVGAQVRFTPAGPRQRYLEPVFGEITETRDLLYRSTTDAAGEPIDLRMDIYRPVGDPVEERPAIVWLFGGWFMFGDKEQLADYARDAARRGFVGVTIDYRTRPGMALSELESAAADAYDDALAAIEWLRRNADTYGVDPDTIISAGYSAGGVLAWNLAYLPPVRGPATSPVAGSVAIAGLPFAGPSPGDPPVIGFHAADDTVVPIGPARDTCAAAAAQGAVCEWIEYPTGGHYVVLEKARDIVRNAYDFIARHILTPRGFMDDPGPVPGPRPSDPEPWPTPTFPLLPSLAPPSTATTSPWSPTTTAPPTQPPPPSAPPTSSGPSTTAPTPTSGPATPSTHPAGPDVGGVSVGPRPGPSGSAAPNRPTAVPHAPGADPIGARPSYTG